MLSVAEFVDLPVGTVLVADMPHVEWASGPRINNPVYVKVTACLTASPDGYNRPNESGLWVGPFYPWRETRGIHDSRNETLRTFKGYQFVSTFRHRPSTPVEFRPVQIEEIPDRYQWIFSLLKEM